MIVFRGLLTVVSLALLCVPAISAQGVQRDPGLFRGQKKEKDDNTRSVQGTVRNASEALLEGAVVQLKDMKTLRVKSFITREDGVYQFYGLSTNVDYELKANHKGESSEVRTLSVFDSRKQAVVHLKVEKKSGGGA